jgi:hypothetical protein
MDAVVTDEEFMARPDPAVVIGIEVTGPTGIAAYDIL